MIISVNWKMKNKAGKNECLRHEHTAKQVLYVLEPDSPALHAWGQQSRIYPRLHEQGNCQVQLLGKLWLFSGVVLAACAFAVVHRVKFASSK
jgi:hypothetical protein